MQFRVVIPAHVKAGQLIRIRCPDGTEGDVTVPRGLKSGDSFVFEMPETETVGNDNAGTRSTGNSDTSVPRVAKSSSFLDREIINFQDFILALGIGLLIGVSIVLGFLMGVLFVTDPFDDGMPSMPNTPHYAQEPEL